MEQFNLEKYIENPSRKVVTREGRNVRIKGYDAKGSYPVIGLLDYGVSERPALFNENGRYWGETDSSLDLYFAPEKHEGWMNMYHFTDSSRHEYGPIFTAREEECIYASKEEAEKEGKRYMDYAKTVKIEWEE